MKHLDQFLEVFETKIHGKSQLLQFCNSTWCHTKNKILANVDMRIHI